MPATPFTKMKSDRVEQVFKRDRDWRSRWDSNPRALADYLISSQARYDHFDTLPYMYPGIWNPGWVLLYGEFRSTGVHSARLGTDRRLSGLRPQQTYVYYHIFVLFASLF